MRAARDVVEGSASQSSRRHHGHGSAGGPPDERAAAPGPWVSGRPGLTAHMSVLDGGGAERGVPSGRGGAGARGPQIKTPQVRPERCWGVTVPAPATKKSTTYPGGEPAGFIIEFENGF